MRLLVCPAIKVSEKHHCGTGWPVTLWAFQLRG